MYAGTQVDTNSNLPIFYLLTTIVSAIIIFTDKYESKQMILTMLTLSSLLGLATVLTNFNESFVFGSTVFILAFAQLVQCYPISRRYNNLKKMENESN